MLSRLIILSCARELLGAMEMAGISHEVTEGWNRAVTDVICQPCVSAHQARHIERRCAELFAEAAEHLRFAQ